MAGRMSLEISVSPPQLAISEGNLVLLTELDGRISFPSEKGLAPESFVSKRRH
jgi:hypothetical protein